MHVHTCSYLPSHVPVHMPLHTLTRLCTCPPCLQLCRSTLSLQLQHPPCHAPAAPAGAATAAGWLLPLQSRPLVGPAAARVRGAVAARPPPAPPRPSLQGPGGEATPACMHRCGWGPGCARPTWAAADGQGWVGSEGMGSPAPEAEGRASEGREFCWGQGCISTCSRTAKLCLSTGMRKLPCTRKAGR